MSVTTYFVRASSRKEAITLVRAKGSILTITNLTTRVFEVSCVDNYSLLAVVTDLVVGCKEDNLYKVEVDLLPK